MTEQRLRFPIGNRTLATFWACLAFLLAWTPVAASQWRIIPEVRLSSGEESDLVIDPSVTRTIVPGGTFVELTPYLAARRWVGRGALLDLGTFATCQRFLNDEGRLLYAQTVWGDLVQSFGSDFRGRLSASVDYLDDSERDTVQRFGEALEAGLAFVRRRWSAEFWGGIGARQYPDLPTTDANMMATTYAEGSWSGGATLRSFPAERVYVTGDAIYQATSANDSYFDSRSWSAIGSADLRMVSSLFLTLSGTYQARDFTSRPTADDDSYWQIGAGLRYVVAGIWTAFVRYGYSMYTWPDGSEEDSQRLAIGIQRTWGRRDAPPPPRVNVEVLTREGEGTIQKPDTKGYVRFRIRAAGASSVTVAGDFNRWDGKSAPLAAVGDGWWEVDLPLEPGSYEYVYVVDGVWTTPPEAKFTVDDGYGGRNGVMEVLPADM